MGTRPACSWTAPCDLHSAPGRQEGRASLCPSPRKHGPWGRWLRVTAGWLGGLRGMQGQVWGRQVQPEGARPPHGALAYRAPVSQPAAQSAPAAFLGSSAPRPLTSLEPRSGASRSSQTIGAPGPQRAASGARGELGQQCPPVAPWPPLLRRLAFPGLKPPGGHWTADTLCPGQAYVEAGCLAECPCACCLSRCSGHSSSGDALPSLWHPQGAYSLA